MKAQLLIITALLFALVTALFAVFNVEPVPVDFLFVRLETPLVLVILASALLGGLVAGLFGIVRTYRLQRRVKSLERQLAAAHTAEIVLPAGSLPGLEATLHDDEDGEPVDSDSDDDAPGISSRPGRPYLH